MHEDFLNFLSNNPQMIFIEAEAKEEKMINFIRQYNNNFNQNINLHSDGICLLGDDVNKWGVELRIYFNDITGIPDYWNGRKYNNRKYHSNEFRFRLDDNGLVRFMFEHNYHIGYN